MSLPVILAVIAAAAFALNNACARRAVVHVDDPGIGALISVPFSAIAIFFILLGTGGLADLGSFTWQAWAWLATAGILHFAVGRTFNFYVIKMVGANLASLLNRFHPLVSVILGMTLLGEQLSWRTAAGVVLIIGGLFITTLRPQRDDLKKISALSGKAYLLGAVVGVSWGLSPILIKVGLGDSSNAMAGTFISFLAAAMVLSYGFGTPRTRNTLRTMNGTAWFFFSFGAIFSTTAQLLRYVALGMGAASLVQPVFAINPIFLLIFSFIFNRRLEAFGPTLIIGILTAVAGTIILL